MIKLETEMFNVYLLNLSPSIVMELFNQIINSYNLRHFKDFDIRMPEACLIAQKSSPFLAQESFLL